MNPRPTARPVAVRPDPVERARRRRRRGGLGWALLWSLMLNHVLLIPAAFFLLRQPPLPEAPLEVELVDPDELRQVVPPRLDPEITPRPPVKRPSQAERKPPPEPKPPEPKSAKPEPPRPEPPRQQPQQPPEDLTRMKMVEVNNPESEKPPENARFLSDKNRRVDRETRARVTNLHKDHPRPQPVARPNRQRLPDPGAKKRQIAESEQQRVERRETRSKRRKVSPLLAMREQAEKRPQPRVDQQADRAPDGDLPAPQQRKRAAARQHAQPELDLDHRDFDRIYGEQARAQRELARLSPSTPKGHEHDKKWQRIRAALENFVPEVQPGNQTALGTRAHPFALYIARAHRKIHKLWGFGFLVDLDEKPDSNPMNEMSLWAMVELVVQADGTIEKATIVKSSGVLTFDVAAIDTVYAATPFPKAPRAIRSRDGKIYLHWRFHRDQRQCGTFGVDPYILDKPPAGPIDGDFREVGRATATAPGGRRQVRRLNRPAGTATRLSGHRPPAPTAVPGRPTPSSAAAHRAAARAAAQRAVASDDPAARAAFARFLDGFARGDAAAMAAACGLPFRSRGRVVARDGSELERMFGDLLRETSSRDTGKIALMSPAEARHKLGRLPRGVSYGQPMLVGRTTLGEVAVTIVLRRQDGRWSVAGLDR